MGNEVLRSTQVRRASRFAVTGVASTAIHALVATLAIEALSFRAAMANGAAFLVATAFSYSVNTRWSFSTTPMARNLGRYFAVSLVSMGLAMVVAAWAEHRGLHYAWGIALVCVVVPAFTFALHNFWTYR